MGMFRKDQITGPFQKSGSLYHSLIANILEHVSRNSHITITINWLFRSV